MHDFSRLSDILHAHGATKRAADDSTLMGKAEQQIKNKTNSNIQNAWHLKRGDYISRQIT